MRRRTLSLLVAMVWLLMACIQPMVQPATTPLPAPIPTLAPTTPAGEPWWQSAIFYEIFVRSFYDSDGDSVGDLNGIIAKLDYLNDGDPATTNDLGVTALWLMPIHPSPSYHGYDVTDYYAVNPAYGTAEDFQRLLAEAHRRGVRVIIDFVMNHTSVEHPWFVEAQAPPSPRRDWYVWSADDPGGALGAAGLASSRGGRLLLWRLLGGDARPQLRYPGSADSDDGRGPLLVG